MTGQATHNTWPAFILIATTYTGFPRHRIDAATVIAEPSPMMARSHDDGHECVELKRFFALARRTLASRSRRTRHLKLLPLLPAFIGQDIRLRSMSLFSGRAFGSLAAREMASMAFIEVRHLGRRAALQISAGVIYWSLPVMCYLPRQLQRASLKPLCKAPSAISPATSIYFDRYAMRRF